MTREDAKGMWIENINVSTKAQYFSIVDCIYNELESRICENCKHSRTGVIDNIILCNLKVSENYNYTWKSQVDKDFGCNKFERKYND